MNRPDFGGKWTSEKLQRVENYLRAYMRAMKNQPFELFYIDAFAGAAMMPLEEDESHEATLFAQEETDDTNDFRKGSVLRALELGRPFDRYILIEEDRKQYESLQEVRVTYPDLSSRIVLVNGDSNEYLRKFCQEEIPRSQGVRGVVFLDPYGMQVEWETMEALARTQVLDVWLLFPLGVAVNRMLSRNGNIQGSWKRALTRVFGDDEWLTAFYEEDPQQRIANDLQSRRRIVELRDIARYYHGKLESIFPAVAQNPLALENSSGNPLYMLFFACANPSPRANGLALKIAENILNPERA